MTGRGFNLILGRYRQMGGRERQLVADFAELHVDAGRWYLEVPVGIQAWHQAQPEARGLDPLWNCKRIDAVVVRDPLRDDHHWPFLYFKPKQYLKESFIDEFRGRDVVIVEAKAGPLGCEAMGQLNGYAALFEEDWLPRTVSRLLVCLSADVSLMSACRRQGIEVTVVRYEQPGILVEDECPAALA